MIGTLISGYRIVRQVGKGGMGVVYKAVNEQIARTTAIKVLNPRYCQDPETVQRLMNEARAVNIVGHPGLINIHEFGQLEDGSGYLIMEFLDGDTLRARLKSHGGRWWPGGVRAAQQIASTLAATHEHGIVHRDLKPDNGAIERATNRTVPRRGEVLAPHGLRCGPMGVASGMGGRQQGLPSLHLHPDDGAVGSAAPSSRVCAARA